MSFLKKVQKSSKVTAASKFAVGDKVVISVDGLKKHSRSVPAHMGYTTEQFSWRKALSKLQDDKTEGTITRVFPNSDNLNVEFDGETFGVSDYMVEKI